MSFAIVPFIDPVIEKLTARIAVSEAARETLTEHLETDAIVVPNGIYVDKFKNGRINERWSGNTLGFIGRFQEPRKGLAVLIDALPEIIRAIPDLKVFVAGPGNPQDALDLMNPELRSRFEFLGRISEAEKADFLTSVGLYVAPNTGGESFGIILAEALACGASIIASDIPAFNSLLGQGQYGSTFESENSQDLARKVISLLKDSEIRKAKAQLGKEYGQSFDWDVVAQKIFDVYEMAMVGGRSVTLSSENRGWSKLIGRGE